MSSKKYDVFISYSRSDRDVVDRIRQALEKNGITYFIDLKGIDGGKSISGVLAQAIQDSEIFLFVGSKNSYASKYANCEVTFAFNNKPKERILPYLVDDSDMPLELVFLFTAFNWRKIDSHPIETVLVDDLLKILHKAGRGTASRYIPKWANLCLQVAHAVLLLGSVVFTGMLLLKFVAGFTGWSFLDNGWNGHFEIAVVTGSFLLAWYGLFCILNWERIGFWIIWAVFLLCNGCYIYWGDYSMFSWQSFLVITFLLALIFTALLFIPKQEGHNIWSQLDVHHNYWGSNRVSVCFWVVAALLSILVWYATIGEPGDSDTFYEQERVMASSQVETFWVDDVPFYMIHVKDSNTEPYLVGMTTVTCRQWRVIMGYNKDYITNWNNPITGVSWFDCLEFCIRLSRRLNQPFSLPSVQQWNYAANAGSFTKYSGSDDIDEVAWDEYNCGNRLHAVGQKKPNAWGFYDMSGNVWEWCSDPVELKKKGVKGRAVCGGSWGSPVEHCQVGGPGNDNYIESSGTVYHGFRLKIERFHDDIQSHIDSLSEILRDRY